MQLFALKVFYCDIWVFIFFALWVRYSRTAMDIVVCRLVNGTLVSIRGMNID